MIVKTNVQTAMKMSFKVSFMALFCHIFMVFCGNVFAEDAVKFSGSTYLGCRNYGNTNDFLTDPNDLTALKPGFIYVAAGCGSLPGSAKYRKISNGAVVEMSQGEKDALDAAESAAQTLSIRNGAKSQLDGFADNPLYQRALADILKEEINLLRKWTRDFKTEVAAATNLANLQTRVATLPTLNDRTLTQLKTAIDARIDDGTIDNG